MVKNILAVLVVVVFLFSLESVSAWSNTTFNNSLSTEFISFTSPGSVLRYLAVPQNTTLTAGFINISYPLGGNLRTGLNLYYDFSSTRERVSGIYNLTNNQGTVVYNNSNCKIGNCAQIFTNINLRIPQNTLMYMNDSYTMSFWLRLTNNTAPVSDEYVFFSPQNVTGRMSVDESSRWTWNGYNASGAASNRTRPLGSTYFMVTVSRNGTNGNVTMYINSLGEGSGFAGTLNTTQPTQFILGANFNNLSDLNAGQMDEFGFWNRTLTPSEINQLYNSGNGFSYDALAGGSLDFNIGTSDVGLFDITNNSVYTNTSSYFSGLQSTVNNYLATCVPVGGYCNVPFNFSSTIGGTFMVYSMLNFTDQGYIVNTNTYNTSTYETSYETFRTNITTTGLSSASLVYNGVSYSANVTQVGSMNQYFLTRAIDVPTNSYNNKTWYWSLSYSDGRTDTTPQLNQTVTPINFTICSSTPLDKSYLNFTFKDEVTQGTLNATIDASSWIYYLGSGTVNKSLSYSSSTLSPNYAFCFNPANKTLNLVLSNLRYASTSYPQRTYNFDVSQFTNNTINRTLYLLSSSEGVYSSILVVQGLGTTPIVGAEVLIELEITPGTFVTVFSGTTDSSGISTAWLNPSYTYRYSVSADGFITETFSLSPSQTTYTVRLQTIAGGEIPYNSSLIGYKWYVTPRPGTLEAGPMTFNLSLISTAGNIYSCRFSLINQSDLSVLNFTTGGTSSYCNLTVGYTVVNNENYFGRLEINNTFTNGTYQVVDTDWAWVTFDSEISTWTTITSFFSDLATLSDWGDNSNKQQFSKIMFFFLITTILLAIFTYITGFELQNPGVSLLLLWFVIAIASISGFLTFESGSNNANQIIRQYGILIVYSMFAIGYVVNQIRRQSA